MKFGVFGLKKLFGAVNPRTALTVGVLSLLSSAVVVAAVRADGAVATNVRLDDGSVWVTNHEKGLVGRLNLRIDELDFAVSSAKAADVLQETVVVDGSRAARTVLFNGRDGGIERVDVVTGEKSGKNETPFVDYRVGGGVAAVLDRESGMLWTGAATQMVAADYPEKPDALVEPGSWLAVTKAESDVNGRLVAPGEVIIIDGSNWYAVALDDAFKPKRLEMEDGEEGEGGVESTVPATTVPVDEGDETEITVAPPEPIAEPELHPLRVNVNDVVAVSSVGSVPVVLLSDGTVVLSDGQSAEIPGDGHVLQQSSSWFGAVLVASSAGLFEIDLESALVTKLTGASASASAPVRVGPCAFGAWSGEVPSWFKTCSSEPGERKEISGAAADAELVFRVNQNNVALNSTGNGDVWADHDGTLAYTGNWSDVEPRNTDSEDVRETTGESREVVERTCIEGGAEAPTAGDDELGVRPRQSVISVLTNDDDVNCEPIAITEVTQPEGDWGTITIIDNGQHLLYSPSDAAREAAKEKVSSFQFTYAVSDIGGNTSAPATVTLTVKDYSKGNLAPALVPKQDDTTREMKAVVEEGRAVSYNVMPDWWDPDGDDMRLVSAVPDAEGQATATPDGVVRFSAAGVTPGVHSVSVTMTDGQDLVTETMDVTVKPIGSKIPPVASDDFVTLAVGETVTIAPLANDYDPNETPLSLRALWTDVGATGYRALPDGELVTITGVEPGVYALKYEATDGTDSTPATIRLEVVAPGEVNSAPIAVPDQVKVRADRVVNVDVLANDVDADQDLLAVVDVSVAASDGQAGIVRGSIVDRRMVQVEVVAGPNGEEPTGPFVITYRVTDGKDQLRLEQGITEEQVVQDNLRSWGSVTVLLQPPSEDQPPVVGNDTAVVREGDVVGVPVLRNDSDPDGDEITLVSVTEADAVKYAEESGGLVWVEGRHVFVQGGKPGRYDMTYNIEAAGRSASGALSVVVKALPNAEDNPNNAPAPPLIEVRAVRNSTVRVPIERFGVDPDGDSVTLDPGLGAPGDSANTVAVDAENPGVILFTAGRLSGPTDEFTYTVADRFGGAGAGTVKVMVLDDGGWAPQAHDDVMRGKPGRVLSVPVLANDTSPHDRPLEIAELPFFNADGEATAVPLNPDFVKILDQSNPATRGRIEVEVPTVDAVLVEHYRITDGLNPSDAYIRVTPDENAPNIPPVANPDEVTAEQAREQGDTVRVDVLANDFDPDDAKTPLTLTLPEGSPATIDGNELLIPRLPDFSRTVLYLITDADGATSVGMVTVPGMQNHPPMLSSNGRNPENRRVDAQTSPPLTIRLADITTDPDGDTDIRLTPTELIQPAVGSVQRLGDGTGFVYTAPKELTQGQTVSIGFEVTDRPNKSLAERQELFCNCIQKLTVQVIVEASSPPYVVGAGAVQVPQLDEPVQYDLTPLTADDQNDPLTYVLDSSTFGGLDVEQNGPNLTLVSKKEGDQKIPVGSNITLRYTVSDGVFPEVQNTVTVTVVGTNKGQPSVAEFETIEAERSVAVKTPNVIAPAFNPFAGEGRPLRLVNSSVSGGASVTCNETGDCEFTSEAVGEFTITYTLEDAVNQAVTGTIPVVVKGKPFAPGVPVVEAVGDKQVTLSWDAADDQGAPIDKYVVTAVEDGLTKEFTTTGGVFDGLINAKTYHFTVFAVNELGDGEASAQSSGGTPDRVPDSPEALAFTDYQNEQLSIQWAHPSTAGDYSAINRYEIRIAGQIIQVDGGQTTAVIGNGGLGAPLSNGVDVDFSMRSRNSATTDGGWGPWSSPSNATERPSRQPDVPTMNQGKNAGDGGQPRVTVTWNAPAFDGGRPITEYRVCRVSPAECQTVNGATSEATFDAIKNTTPSFTVEAFNTDKNRDNSGPSDAVQADTVVGKPGVPNLGSLSSGNRSVSASATPRNDSGCGESVLYSIQPEGGSWSAWQPGGEFLNLTNGQYHNVRVKSVHNDGCYRGSSADQFESDPASFSDRARPLGDLQPPGAMNVTGGSKNREPVKFSWSIPKTHNDATGREWRLDISGCGTVASDQQSGEIMFDQDPAASTTCVVVLRETEPGNKEIGRSERSATVPAKPPPVSVSASVGARSTSSTQCLHGDSGTGDLLGCYQINVTMRNYPGPQTVRCYHSTSGGTWSQIGSYTAGNGTHSGCPSYSSAGRAVAVLVGSGSLQGKPNGSSNSGGGLVSIIHGWPTY